MLPARENALRIIRFDRPQYVMSQLPLHWLTYNGCNHEGYEGGGHHLPVGSKWTDIWGTTWEREHDGVMGFPVGNPLDDRSKLATYQWPDPDDPRIIGRIDVCASAERNPDTFIAGQHRNALWERACTLAGMSNIMEAFYTDPDFAREALRRIMDFQLGIAKHYIRHGIEVAMLTDDLGTQRGPLLGPGIVNEFLRPQYERLFDFYRSRGVICHLHSCGCIDSFLDMFMDLGVSILNPVQANANDLDDLRRRTMGKMALEGGVSSATIMEGPPQRIEAEVRQRLWQLGREGGYFCAPDQGMPWPKEHIDALNAAVAKWGQYPLADPEA